MQVNAFGANPYRHLLRLGDRSVSREPNCGCLIFSATKISIRTAEIFRYKWNRCGQVMVSVILVA